MRVVYFGLLLIVFGTEQILKQHVYLAPLRGNWLSARFSRWRDFFLFYLKLLPLILLLLLRILCLLTCLLGLFTFRLRVGIWEIQWIFDLRYILSLLKAEFSLGPSPF